MLLGTVVLEICCKLHLYYHYLKSKGYRVCVNVTERGENICYSDPNIDELLIQKTDQISIESRLTEYWEKMSPCFDKFIQLSESIEGSLLLVGDRV